MPCMPLYTTVASAPSDSLFRAPCTNILTYLVLIRTYFLQWLQVFRLANLMNDNAVLRLAVYIRSEPNTPFMLVTSQAEAITGRRCLVVHWIMDMLTLLTVSES